MCNTTSVLPWYTETSIETYSWEINKVVKNITSFVKKNFVVLWLTFVPSESLMAKSKIIIPDSKTVVFNDDSGREVFTQIFLENIIRFNWFSAWALAELSDGWTWESVLKEWYAGIIIQLISKISRWWVFLLIPSPEPAWECSEMKHAKNNVICIKNPSELEKDFIKEIDNLDSKESLINLSRTASLLRATIKNKDAKEKLSAVIETANNMVEYLNNLNNKKH